MTRDADVLRAWLLIVFFLAAIGVNAVPIIYSFLPWRKHIFGKMFMLQAVAFACLFDFTALFQFWKPSVLVVFWISVSVFGAIAIATFTLSWGTLRLRYPSRGRKLKVIFTGRVYDILKRIVQIALPALATLYFLLGQIWGVPNVEQVVGTITAVTAFLGALLGLSTKTYNLADNTWGKYDGSMEVVDVQGEKKLVMIPNTDPEILQTKKEIILRVNNTQ